jgi:hypothetical protein
MVCDDVVELICVSGLTWHRWLRWVWQLVKCLESPMGGSAGAGRSQPRVHGGHVVGFFGAARFWMIGGLVVRPPSHFTAANE